MVPGSTDSARLFQDREPKDFPPKMKDEYWVSPSLSHDQGPMDDDG